MLSGISIVCFAASYAVGLCLEISRLFFRLTLRTPVMLGFIAAGVFAHTVFLVREALGGLEGGPPLSSWYHGCLMIAWVLAVAYLGLSVRQARSAIGLFFLPTILALVAIAQVFPRTPQLTDEAATRVWSMVHGFALLLGTAAVVVGFLGGIFYLWQSYRLKKKSAPIRGLRLPSLEKLQRISEGALFTSCFLLLIGLISGILINWNPGSESVVPWTDPVIWTSGLLLVWLVAVLTFNSMYKPARQGRKVAYLTTASFIFLGFVLAIILLVPSSHGTRAAPPPSEEPESRPQLEAHLPDTQRGGDGA